MSENKEECTNKKDKVKAVCKDSVKRLFLYLLVIAFGVFIGHIISVYVGHRVIVRGSSMEPTYHEGDVLWAWVAGDVSYGSIVITSDPEDGTYIIKRVVGLPNDTIQILDGMVLLNGRELVESYIVSDWNYSGIAKDVITLGNDEYFIMGDNRSNSKDSRYFGPIKVDSIRGVVK